MMKRLLPIVLLLAGCASSSDVPRLDPAPWSAAPLQAAEAPDVLLTEWGKAENRATCAPLAFASLGEHSDARPRRANFAGGWAVAWDKTGLPGTAPTGDDCQACGRGVFGIAGTGVDKGGSTFQWPFRREWADGSVAGYGLEGGTGPKYLAYVEIEGQQCLYNVWSHLGKEHLEFLLTQLRKVE